MTASDDELGVGYCPACRARVSETWVRHRTETVCSDCGCGTYDSKRAYIRDLRESDDELADEILADLLDDVEGAEPA